MESIKLTLSLQDVSRILQAVTARPYAEVADLVDNLKRQVEWNANEQRQIRTGVQEGTLGAVIPNPPNGEQH